MQLLKLGQIDEKSSKNKCIFGQNHKNARHIKGGMNAMSKQIDSRLPNDIAKNALPSHAAIKTPWERLISVREANEFINRHRAGTGAVMMEVLRILIPDYEERCQRLCECAERFYSFAFGKDGYNMAGADIRNFHIHPFMRGGFLCGLSGDEGDEFLGMYGRVTDFGTHRIEKELDTCPWELMGSEICRTSTWAGMEVIGNEFQNITGGPKMRISMVEAKGCGDRHCRIVGESYEKYPMPERKIWDNFGPIATEDYIKYTPDEKCLEDGQIFREECNFTYRNGLCYEYDSSRGYDGSAASPLGIDYTGWVFDDMLAKNEITMDELTKLIENVFEACGKMMFLDSYAVRGVRDWMGVPDKIVDGRVIGGYIEIYLQARKAAYDIVAFNKDEVIYDIDEASFGLGNQYMKLLYIPLWYGMCKSMVNYQWALWEEKEDVPEGKFRIKIAKKIDKFAR